MADINLDDYIEPFSDFLMSNFTDKELNNIEDVIKKLINCFWYNHNDLYNNFKEKLNDLVKYYFYFSEFVVYYFKIVCDYDVSLTWFTPCYYKDIDHWNFIAVYGSTASYNEQFILDENILTGLRSVQLNGWGFDEINLPSDLVCLCIYHSNVKKINFNPVNNLRDLHIGDCPNLTSVILPEGVEGFDSVDFNRCTSLSKLELPRSLKKIGAYFCNHNSIKEVIYRGTQKEWNRIRKDKTWNVGSSIEAIICTDGTIYL